MHAPALSAMCTRNICQQDAWTPRYYLKVLEDLLFFFVIYMNYDC